MCGYLQEAVSTNILRAAEYRRFYSVLRLDHCNGTLQDRPNVISHILKAAFVIYFAACMNVEYNIDLHW